LRYGVQVLASWRTEVTCTVAKIGVAPLSRVADAPAPVAPAVPVGPLVAAVEAAEVIAFELLKTVPRTSTVLCRNWRSWPASPPCSLYDVIETDSLVPVPPASVLTLPAVPPSLLTCVADAGIPFVRTNPGAAAPIEPVPVAAVAAPPLELLPETSPGFRQPVTVISRIGGWSGVPTTEPGACALIPLVSAAEQIAPMIIARVIVRPPLLYTNVQRYA
jgi:hypothetical protein